MRRLKLFLSLTFSQQCILLEAIFCLAVARMAISLIPFRFLSRFIGKTTILPNALFITPDQLIGIKKISWAINVSCRNVVWQAKCLVQALAGVIMLKRRGLPSTLYLGVAKKTNSSLAAHAWLRSGDYILTGGKDLELYTVLSSFSQPNK